MHGSHTHAPGQAHTNRHDTNERRMGLAALITGLFMFVEIAGGIISGSLALFADAGHMLTDLGSLSLAWFGFRLARRPARLEADLRLRPLPGAGRVCQRPRALRHRGLDRARGRRALAASRNPWQAKS